VSADCANPVSFQNLVGYWAGDLSTDETAAVDVHVIGCAACTRASERIALITEGIRATFPPAITAGQLEVLRARGLRIEENTIQPGKHTPLLFRADLDVLAHRLSGLDLSRAKRVHLTVRAEETGEILFQDPSTPFDPDAGELIIACQRHFAAFPPNIVFEVVAIAPDGTETAARYAVPHHFERATR
jgi:hypothetical protein